MPSNKIDLFYFMEKVVSESILDAIGQNALILGSGYIVSSTYYCCN